MRNSSSCAVTHWYVGFAIAATSALCGCDPGDESNPTSENEPTCTAVLTMSGTLTTPDGNPPSAQGCVPLGTWNVTVATAMIGTCTAVPTKASYKYVVANPDFAGNPRGTTVTYSGTPEANEEVDTNIHAGGGGECEGTFTHVLPATGGSYHQIILKPYFDKGTVTLKGTGAYELWPKKP
jgi:hypothetical protein